MMDRIVSEYLEVGKTSTIWGIPIADLNKDQLIACIGYLTTKNREDVAEHTRQLKFVRDLRR